MRTIAILSLASILFSGALKAQENKKDYPRTALYVEAGGRNFLFGVEADFLVTKKQRLSAGIGIYAFGGPNIMYHYLIGNGNSKFELGIGVMGRVLFSEKIDVKENLFIFSSFIGYRYQEKNGLVLRVGFTPSYCAGSFDALLPFGLSLGYSF